jgi:hypothetical protein
VASLKDINGDYNVLETDASLQFSDVFVASTPPKGSNALPGITFAVINSNIVTLHFVDGKRGESDLAVNDTIVDPGAPAQQASNFGASGGGGGLINNNRKVAPFISDMDNSKSDPAYRSLCSRSI